ncbi:MAG TPA: ComF family protein [Casimicrobiaceae bacterium]|nr:ComF family protein [Casimicrobiaceae bacterium]
MRAHAAAACARALRAALPQTCSLCADPSGDALLCDACIREMPRIDESCPRCASASPSGATCGACLVAPPPQAATIAAWRYAFPADRLLHSFKYRGRLAFAEPLADAIVAAVTARGTVAPDVLVAVPLARSRQLVRGYNHAQEIARRISLRLGVPLANGLRRVRDAPPQAASGLAARAQNVRGAFAATMRHDGLTVAIVDDVMTTGATLAAAAAAMHDSGAARVEAWVVARTPSPKAR